MHYVDIFPIGVFCKSGTTKIWGGAFAPPAPPLATPLLHNTKQNPCNSYLLHFLADKHGIRRSDMGCILYTHTLAIFAMHLTLYMVNIREIN